MTHTLEFSPISKEELDAYMDDIKGRLVKDAPEWHITSQQTSTPTECLWHHLARFDFSKGKDLTWDIPISTWVFAYEEHKGNGVYQCFKLNLHPLEHKLDEGTISE
jgi:hypothetical protein